MEVDIEGVGGGPEVGRHVLPTVLTYQGVISVQTVTNLQGRKFMLMIGAYENMMFSIFVYILINMMVM